MTSSLAERLAREVMDAWSSDPAHTKANDGIEPFGVWKALVDQIAAAIRAALTEAAKVAREGAADLRSRAIGEDDAFMLILEARADERECIADAIEAL